MGSFSSQKKIPSTTRGLGAPVSLLMEPHLSSIRALDRDLLALLLEGWQLSDILNRSCVWSMAILPIE